MSKDMLKQRRMVGAELGACCVPRTAELTRSLTLRVNYRAASQWVRFTQDSCCFVFGFFVFDSLKFLICSGDVTNTEEGLQRSDEARQRPLEEAPGRSDKMASWWERPEPQG